MVLGIAINASIIERSENRGIECLFNRLLLGCEDPWKQTFMVECVIVMREDGWDAKMGGNEACYEPPILRFNVNGILFTVINHIDQNMRIIPYIIAFMTTATSVIIGYLVRIRDCLEFRINKTSLYYFQLWRHKRTHVRLF